MTWRVIGYGYTGKGKACSWTEQIARYDNSTALRTLGAVYRNTFTHLVLI